MNCQKSSLGTTIIELNKEKNILEQQLSNLNGQNNDLKSQLNNLKSKETYLTTLSVEIDELKQENSILQQTVSNQTQPNSPADALENSSELSLISHLKSIIADLTKSSLLAEIKNKELHEKIHQLNNEKASLENTITGQSEIRFKAFDDEHTKSSSSITSFESAESCSHKFSIGTIPKSCHKKYKKTHVIELENEVSDLKCECSKLRNLLKIAQTELDGITSETSGSNKKESFKNLSNDSTGFKKNLKYNRNL